MNKLRVLGTRKSPLQTTIGFGIVALAVVTFWFSTSPSGLAGPTQTCTVCHKMSQTLSFPCDSFDYRRHLDHGDQMGACQVTPTQNP